MKYIILDLEATCWEDKAHEPNEIIEIGAVCVNEAQEIIGEFGLFIKPSIHTILSDFCTELTTITQDMIQNAPTFPTALAKFQAWIQSFEDEYWLCSWGFYDRSQLKKECESHQLDAKWLKKHISLKHQHGDMIGEKKGIGMSTALQQENIALEGTHHRGLDDAKNITKIFLKYFDKWHFKA